MRSLLSLRASTLAYDVSAGLAVFFVAIPLCLGIAHASGAPLMAGLIAGIIGGLVTGTISGSHLAISGPAAGLTAIMLQGLAKLGTFEALLVATFLGGLIQLGLGFAKAGFVAKFFPAVVIKGMLAAIGLLLIIKEFPHLIGYDLEEFGVEEFELTRQDINERYPNNSGLHNTFSVLLEAIANINMGAFFIGVGALVFIVIWEKTIGKRLKTIPASLVVVLIGVIVVETYRDFFPSLQLEADHMVQIPPIRGIKSLIGELHQPSWEALGRWAVWQQALTIAIVASIESLLSVEATDKLDPEQRTTDPNRELIAQGVGNTLSGLLGGLPLTAVIVRGSVNLAAGAKTKLSAILHGFFILFSLLFLSSLLNMIPLAALAAILIYAGYKLLNPALLREYWDKGYELWLPFIATIVAIILSNLLTGVAVGIVICMVFIVWNAYRSPGIELVDIGPRKRLILGHNITFLHKSRLTALLARVPNDCTLEVDTGSNRFLDPELRQMILDFAADAPPKNIEVLVGSKLMSEEYKMELNEKIRKAYRRLFVNNRRWANEHLKNDENYFKRLSNGQAPEYLFIGCSDSRLPAEQILGTEPGELFVHRNIANLVVHTDVNLMSVLQYSVEVLNVKHIILCGHYGCGGVKASTENRYHGLIDQWLGNIKDVQRHYKDELDAIQNLEAKLDRLVELNVREQVYNIMKTNFVQRNREQYGWPEVHGWVYDIKTGLIKDLRINPAQEFPALTDIFRFEHREI